MERKIESEQQYDAALAEYDALSAAPADREILAALSELEEALDEWEQTGKYGA